MQENNKFEDLVLENDSKKSKQRQLIFKIIIFVIIFLIAAIFYKIIASTNNSKPALPPIETNAEFVQKSDENEVFENIKSDNEGFSDDFASLEERLKKENNIIENKPKENNIVKELVEAKPIIKDTPVQKPEVKKPIKDIDTLLQEEKKEVVKKQESSVFDTIEVKKPSPKVNTVSTNGIYIQVYAGKKIDLKSHEIKKLDNLGLKYKVVTDKTGMSRVIVGPYNQSDKMSALSYIRENVKKDAFFYRGQ